jgi:hypothetical protein
MTRQLSRLQAVHDKSQCLLHIPRYTSFKEGLQKTIDWALSTTADARKLNRQNLSVELLGDAQFASALLPEA